MELVTDIGRIHPPDLLTEAVGLRVDINGDEAVAFFSPRVESDHVGQGLDGRLSGEARRRIETLIGSEKGSCHLLLLSGAPVARTCE